MNNVNGPPGVVVHMLAPEDSHSGYLQGHLGACHLGIPHCSDPFTTPHHGSTSCCKLLCFNQHEGALYVRSATKYC